VRLLAIDTAEPFFHPSPHGVGVEGEQLGDLRNGITEVAADPLDIVRVPPP